jgi:Ca2+-transporting ATPase
LANRDLSRPALLGVTDPNPWLWRIAAAMVVLLAAVMGIAWLRHLMGLALPGAQGAVVAGCLLALCLVWLELVRLAGRHQRHTASGARGTA